MIGCMLALTSFAADKGKNLFDNIEAKKGAEYSRGLKLYKQGCNGIEQGYVLDTSRCIAAFSILKSVVQKDQNTFSANFYLSKIYYYQPKSFNWSVKKKSNSELKKISLKHLNKALQLKPNHLEAKKLRARLNIKKTPNENIQGL